MKKSCWCLLLLIFTLQLDLSDCHHHPHRSRHRHHIKLGKAGRTAPAPTPTPKPNSTDLETDEDEEARGLKGRKDVLASFQKSRTKCNMEGSYGIRGECSKYTYCKKVGLISTTRYCPSDKFFDHLHRICLQSKVARCKEVCKVEGRRLTDPLNSHGYLLCMKKVPMPRECQKAGEVFNFRKQTCIPVKDTEADETDDTPEPAKGNKKLNYTKL